MGGVLLGVIALDMEQSVGVGGSPVCLLEQDTSRDIVFRHRGREWHRRSKAARCLGVRRVGARLHRASVVRVSAPERRSGAAVF